MGAIKLQWRIEIIVTVCVFTVFMGESEIFTIFPRCLLPSGSHFWHFRSNTGGFFSQSLLFLINPKKIPPNMIGKCEETADRK
ncbi:mannose-1-phosphate guanylyltransferase/mannose-6-phosphate isomerase [Anopheles sinensis]|uniref:Mannose-1-phosphate guanylyltransferase/mannose-6-phosphate isomerase n=1 Tax=Anopheles sinensis TaxID=74873 RepID=A0A084VDL1_ANOSI|nr:mannose-1-phosphate guanylyltransferase/mannose-6-phosphate isomerase [Anopheles sinensis]